MTVKVLTRGALVIDSRFKEAGIEVSNAPLRSYLDLTSARELRRMLKSLPEGPVVIHAHRYRDAAIALIARRMSGRKDVRIIATRHAVRRGRDSWFFRWIYSGVDEHIFVSRAAYDRFRRSWADRMAPLPERKVSILHNSLNLIRPGILPEPEKGSVTALYYGPIAPHKGLETLIDAMSALRGRKLRLTIAGGGSPDFLDMLRRRAMTRGVMEMIDWNIPAPEAETLIAKTHFGVVSSVESEAGGINSLRFMAYGRPQASTAIGAPAEYLRDGHSALIVRPADAAGLAEAMKLLAADPELRKRMGAEAFKEYSRRLDWNLFIRRLDKIYFRKDK